LKKAKILPRVPGQKRSWLPEQERPRERGLELFSLRELERFSQRGLEWLSLVRSLQE
jgi:hypothetical protein